MKYLTKWRGKAEKPLVLMIEMLEGIREVVIGDKKIIEAVV